MEEFHDKLKELKNVKSIDKNVSRKQLVYNNASGSEKSTQSTQGNNCFINFLHAVFLKKITPFKF